MINCRGHRYDEAGNMSGKYTGAAQLIKNVHPKALYSHCASHRLSLCVSNSCQIPSIIKVIHFSTLMSRQSSTSKMTTQIKLGIT